MSTIEINGIATEVPAGAIAYKYADPTEGARWIYDESDLAEIRSADPSLIVAPSKKYTWRTDAARGEIEAATVDEALAEVVAQNEWAELYSRHEALQLKDGAWLTIFDADGVPVLRRGEMP